MKSPFVRFALGVLAVLAILSLVAVEVVAITFLTEAVGMWWTMGIVAGVLAIFCGGIFAWAGMPE